MYGKKPFLNGFNERLSILIYLEKVWLGDKYMAYTKYFWPVFFIISNQMTIYQNPGYL